MIPPSRLHHASAMFQAIGMGWHRRYSVVAAFTW